MDCQEFGWRGMGEGGLQVAVANVAEVDAIPRRPLLDNDILPRLPILVAAVDAALDREMPACGAGRAAQQACAAAIGPFGEERLPAADRAERPGPGDPLLGRQGSEDARR